MAGTRDRAFSPCLNRMSRSSTELPQEIFGAPMGIESDDGKVQSIAPGTLLEQKSSEDSGLANKVMESHDMSSQLDKDPFVTPVRGTRLSPTASAFTPVSDPGLTVEPPASGPMSVSLSCDIGLSHSIEISASPSVHVEDVEAWFLRVQLTRSSWFDTRQILPSMGHIAIHFADIRDAMFVHDNFALEGKDVHVTFLDTQRARYLFTAALGDMAYGSAQVQAMISIPATLKPHISQSMDTVITLLEKHGRLFSFVKQVAFSDGSFKAVAEYCSTSATKSAIQLYSCGAVAAGLHLTVRPWGGGTPASASAPHANCAVGRDTSTRCSTALHTQDSMALSRVSPAYPVHSVVFPPRFQACQPLMMERYPAQTTGSLEFSMPMTPISPGYPLLRSMYQTPPSPATTSHYTQSPSRSASGSHDGRRQNATRVNRSPNAVGSHHNHVDTARIRGGIDVRTTIMLRNIPNKVDQAMLKRLVDESSWGKYDFMYLRIDFANDCNVGYAFINFVDPLDIVDFVMARGNQRWNCFKSDKVAEISYATIQGKDCLVQKFRNSSVMLEAPHYRPKLYFTCNGPMPDLAGEEEPFPEPDNQSKMKRSCENAEHVGLFTPNAGQHFRDEQRRRRSQYDRGTRLAALEEYDYETAIQQLCRISSD